MAAPWFRQVSAAAALLAAALLAQLFATAANEAPLVYEADENCTWPTCSKHRVACDSKLVGTCLMPLPGCSNKFAECVIGRCVCPEDWCSHPFGHECVPQVVYEGARPPDFERGLWLRVFVSLGEPQQFPRMWELEHKWSNLISVHCGPAVLLWLAGLLIASGTGLVLCYDLVRCVCLHRQPETETSNLLIAGLECVDNEPPHRHRREKEPSSWPLIVLVILNIVLCALAVMSRAENWTETKGILKDQARRLKSNALNLTYETGRLNETTHELSSTFELIAECSENPVMAMIGKMARNSTVELAEVVHLIHSHVDSVPTTADDFMDALDSNTVHAVWGICIPMFLMFIMCLGLLAEVIGTRYFATSATARYEDQALGACACLFVLIIAVVATASACILSILIGVAQICDDVDANLVMYAAKQPDANLTGLPDMARYYVQGDVYNPLNDYIDQAEMYVESIHDLWFEYEDAIIKPQSMSCPPLLSIDIDEVQNVSEDTLIAARKLVNTSNIFPYYHETVHDGICNHMPKEIGLYLIQLVIVGLVLFPFSAIFTHNFLAHHVGAQTSSPDADGSSSSDEDTAEEEHEKGQKPGGDWEIQAPPLKTPSLQPGLSARDIY